MKRGRGVFVYTHFRHMVNRYRFVGDIFQTEYYYIVAYFF